MQREASLTGSARQQWALNKCDHSESLTLTNPLTKELTKVFYRGGEQYGANRMVTDRPAPCGTASLHLEGSEVFL